MTRDVLYFGRNRPAGGLVSDSAWATFLDSVITPRFPAGLSVVEGGGQWRGKSGSVEKERSEIITIYHGGGPENRQAIGEIVAEYERRFQQEAVLHARSQECVQF